VSASAPVSAATADRTMTCLRPPPANPAQTNTK
jgi:hypothetical protein